MRMCDVEEQTIDHFRNNGPAVHIWLHSKHFDEVLTEHDVAGIDGALVSVDRATILSMLRYNRI